MRLCGRDGGVSAMASLETGLEEEATIESSHSWHDDDSKLKLTTLSSPSSMSDLRHQSRQRRRALRTTETNIYPSCFLPPPPTAPLPLAAYTQPASLFAMLLVASLLPKNTFSLRWLSCVEAVSAATRGGLMGRRYSIVGSNLEWKNSNNDEIVVLLPQFSALLDMQVGKHSRSFSCNEIADERGGQTGESAFVSSLNEKDVLLATLWNDLLPILRKEYAIATNKRAHSTNVVDKPWCDSSIIDSILDFIPRGGGGDSGSSNHRRDENGNMMFAGLVNMGNTCYLNAQLQCAYHIPYLRQLVLDARDEVVQIEVEVEEEIDDDTEIVAQRDGMEEGIAIDDQITKSEEDIEASYIIDAEQLPLGAAKATKTITKKVMKDELKSITDALRGLQMTFKSLDNKSPYATSGNTEVLCRTLDIDPYVQQDGQEFWKLFIPEIEYNKLANLYSGHYTDYVREILPDTEVMNQEESSMAIDDDYGEEKKEEVEFVPAELEVKKDKAQERISTVVFSDLSIPVSEGTGGSVESALREMFTEPEILRVSEGNGWRPSKGAEKVDAYKGFSLQREGLPAILQLHLKRFKYDYDTGETSKINDRCSFPLELDLSELTDHNREDDDEDINDIYDLQSIVIHKGDYGSGHYYSYVRPEIHLDEWYRFDDEFVTRVDYTDVIADAYGGNNALLQRKRSRSDSFESVDSQQHEVQQQQRGLLRRIFPLFGLFRRSRTPERRGGFGYGGRTSNAYMLQYVHRSDVPKLYPATHH